VTDPGSGSALNHPALAGRVAIVTGANHGIGAATAVALAVLAAIAGTGATGLAAEADLSDPQVPVQLFDQAERELGPVDILVNNATGWLADTFKASGTDRLGRTLTPVSAATFDRLFAVDARGGALMTAEFARRHLARGARYGRIISLTSGTGGFPEEVSYGAA
jgi:3-oxoacyl-[acyl-carrier protein] reductase